MNDSIEIRGAKEHNLKNISLSIPHRTLTTLTGVSGSGKSSLAFDTIFKEGQRRYLESLSAYARQFLGVMAKADVEHIEGLSPTISIDQKSVNKNPRSTVGTVTEIYDFFRLLFARLGTPYCSKCGHKISKQSEDQIAQTVLRDFKDKRILILAPIVRDRKGEYRKEIEDVKNAGYTRIRIDNIVYKFEENQIPELKRYEKHTLEIVIDRIKTEDKYLSRITDDIERAIRITKGLVAFYEEHEIETEDNKENETDKKTKRKKTKISKQSEIDKYYRLYTTERSCANCGHSIADIEPNLFSFNNPMGACSVCGGLGVEHIFTEEHIIRDENLNIYEGALSCFVDDHIGFDMEYGFEELETIAKVYKINLKKAWKDLTKTEKKYLLYGTDKEIRWRKRFWYHSKIVMEKLPGILTRLKYDYETYKMSYYENFMDEIECPKCKGKRINEDALAVKFDGKTIADFSSMTIEELFDYFSKLKLKPSEEIIGNPIIKEIVYRLTFLVKVGLTYLTIERASPTLSGGESQRIRLASQIGSGLEGVLYVLDEPSIGLHQSDNKKLIESLKTLRDKNNTVIVVEHDKETMEESDYLVDIGLDAGVSGGNIVGIGNFEEFIKSEKSYTAKYLRGEDDIPIPKTRREGNGKFLKIIGASQFNLKNIDVKIPLGLFLVISGLSGSGKSTLIDNILMRALHNHFYGKTNGKTFNVGKHKKIEGLENIDKVIEVDQSPIGRTPRSNPATYTKVFSPIRDLFAATKLAKMRGYDKGRFSFNVKTGRCPTCEGAGLIELEMQFLSNVLVPCEECGGKRFNAETLDIKYKDKNIYDVLELTVSEAIEFFDGITSITRILKIMEDIGLGYIKLGQPSTTLSGGEAQRIKLASELHKISTGNTLYILDEPTTGLHFEDIKKLLNALNKLVEKGNTVIVVEHNLDVIKCADYIIDMGPLSGDKGGRIVAEGKPEDVIKVKESLTAKELKEILNPKSKTNKKENSKKIAKENKNIEENFLTIKGANKHNLKNINLKIPKNKINVITGVSGSGKTSLAFETIFKEGQRRFVESLSTYARRFLGRFEDAKVDRIEGLSPAIAIDQKNVSRNPRSTVATVTEIYDYFRLIFARVSTPHCPHCADKDTLKAESPSILATEITETMENYKLIIISPIYHSSLNHRFALYVDDINSYSSIKNLMEKIRNAGYLRIQINSSDYVIDDITEEKIEELSKEEIYSVGIVIDRIVVGKDKRARISYAIEKAMDLSGGIVHIKSTYGIMIRESFHTKFPACLLHGILFDFEITPRHFSFNSHWGYCPECKGLGSKPAFSIDLAIKDKTKPLLNGALDTMLHNMFSTHGKYYTDSLFNMLKRKGIGKKELEEIPFNELKEETINAFFFGGDSAVGNVIEYWHLNNDITSEDYSEWKDKSLAKFFVDELCPECGGERLNEIVRAYTIDKKNISQVSAMTVETAINFFDRLPLILSERENIISKEAIKEIKTRLSFLDKVGLNYLSLNRKYSTLSGGEAQRIRLASQLGSKLTGVLYVLDEPTVGLHPKDTGHLLDTLKELRDLKNTLVIVEHDRDTMKSADNIIDMGPQAGAFGGEVVFEGKFNEIIKDKKSLTGEYLSGAKKVFDKTAIREENSETIKLKNVSTNNLKNIDIEIPLKKIVVVTGVSGSGKSSLIIDTLYPALKKRKLNQYSKYESAHIPDIISDTILVDQISIVGSIRSTLISYSKVFDKIRNIFAKTQTARAKGFSAGRFSYNAKEGRCNICDGKGIRKIAMHFLSDMEIVCEACGGKRYNDETLSVRFKSLNIAEVLELTVDEALEFFEFDKSITKTLSIMSEVGLGYIKLSQRLDTFSGGELQRLKLSTELSKKQSDEHIVYILDEPTTGLHFDDVNKLLIALNKLADKGHSVIIIEHNPEVIRAADYIIDLGLDGGINGGEIIAKGTVEEILEMKKGYTWRYI